LWVQEFTAGGFVIEHLVEHRPDPQMARHHPRAYAKLSREPGFIAVRLAKNALTAPCPTTDMNG
jgi:hypothetical protein